MIKPYLVTTVYGEGSLWGREFIVMAENNQEVRLRLEKILITDLGEYIRDIDEGRWVNEDVTVLADMLQVVPSPED